MCWPASRRARLPRTRGDGPVRSKSRSGRMTASPHPRGWTPAVVAYEAVRRGFPAPAGMDPRRRRLRGRPERLPRTRGDGPNVEESDLLLIGASPHPRGWTPLGIARHLKREGFPAPAGMDLRESGSQPPGHGLPRTRGDGPVGDQVAVLLSTASPHPRGWTPAGRRAERAPEGFPAPAGMDRREGAELLRSAGLPRTRGDGPVSSSVSLRPVGASPHPRGWTRDRPLVKRFLTGFPAPAGMDPDARSPRPPERRLPPHPRGWTLAMAGLDTDEGSDALVRRRASFPSSRRLTQITRGTRTSK